MRRTMRKSQSRKRKHFSSHAVRSLMLSVSSTKFFVSDWTWIVPYHSEMISVCLGGHFNGRWRRESSKSHLMTFLGKHRSRVVLFVAE